MDWLRQIPIGQYVDGTGSWLRLLDPRLKLAWTLAFLLTPILAGPWWRLALVGALLLITASSGLPWRLWRRTLPLLLVLSLLVGGLATT
ncbi:MAG: energy-coupling factor transporter transmembrane protein EcfT, partial [Vulcanococcus sp.]